jgi:2-(1,2-epoxy-1,2-dihydrophenyl)acetyl-CoA isomerase
MSDVMIERKSRVLWLTMNRPAVRNALTRDVVRALTSSLTAAGTESDVRAVVLSGAGGNFCAGADLRATFEQDPDLLEHLEGYLDEYHALIRAIVRCPKPTLAMLDGAAVGFGADLALACDLRVASARAYIQESFVKIGLMPDGGGTFWLPRLLGTSRAMQMILLAGRLHAPELLQHGLVLSVSSPEDLAPAASAVAARLAAGPPLAYAAVKQALYDNWGDLEEALRREREGQLRLLRSKDAMEGIMSFLQKREPDFQGA